MHYVNRDRLLTISHIVLEKYLGASRRTRYNGVRVIMELQCHNNIVCFSGKFLQLNLVFSERMQTRGHRVNVYFEVCYMIIL